MSDNVSQQELYKDKCLYTTLNILLSKIQRLERRVHILEAEKRNIQNMYNKKLIPNKTNMSSVMNHINRLDVKLNEQNKIINTYIKNKEPNTDALASDLDDYLKDIDEIMEFKINNVVDFNKLKN
jgi:polyhydroxyalkanoate synthesis regulator phasin